MKIKIGYYIVVGEKQESEDFYNGKRNLAMQKTEIADNISDRIGNGVFETVERITRYGFVVSTDFHGSLFDGVNRKNMSKNLIVQATSQK